MRDIISKYCGGMLIGLVNALMQDISNPSQSQKHLFEEMVQKIDLKGKSGMKGRNISFASKFLCYACEYLNVAPPYAYRKYDSVVSDVISIYHEGYLHSGRFDKKTIMKIDGRLPSDKDVVDKYIEYCNLIHDILKDPVVIREGFASPNHLDLVVWYSNKGN